MATSQKSSDMSIHLLSNIAKQRPKFEKIRITLDLETKLLEAQQFTFNCNIGGSYYHFSERKSRIELVAFQNSHHSHIPDLDVT